MRVWLFTSLILFAITTCLATPSSADSPKFLNGREFNSADFAETVNYYISLGERAACVDFLKREKEDDRYFKKGFDITERICMLCRVLYEPNTAEPLRDASLGGRQLPDKSMPASKWPLLPVVKSGHTYFVLAEGRFLAGMAESVEEYLKYCASAGRFRTVKIKVPTRSEALHDAGILRNTQPWKDLRSQSSNPSIKATDDSERLWRRVVSQAKAIPVASTPSSKDTKVKERTND